MSKLHFLIFLAIGTYVELFSALSVDISPFIEMLYIIGWFILLFSKRMPWIRVESIINIGLASLVMFIIDCFGEFKQIHVLYNLFCLFIWIKSIIYFQNYENTL